MIQFYAPDIEQTLVLPESDSAHAVRVLRMKSGDEITAIDGKGNRFLCRITEANQKKTSVEIVNCETIGNFWKGKLTVAVAPTKNLDRIEWLTEKLTEIGVDCIVPLKCCHSERKELKTERIKKIAVSAMKQSLKTVLPEISEMISVKDFMVTDNSDQKFIAFCDPAFPRLLLANEFKANRSASILIGPEGDFSPEEIELAISHGYKPVSLGDARLRTETAALVACETFHIVNQIYNSK